MGTRQCQRRSWQRHVASPLAYIARVGHCAMITGPTEDCGQESICMCRCPPTSITAPAEVACLNAPSMRSPVLSSMVSALRLNANSDGRTASEKAKRVVTDRRNVAQLRAAGESLGEIAAEMHLSKTTVARIRRETAV